jgi:dGTPase
MARRRDNRKHGLRNRKPGLRLGDDARSPSHRDRDRIYHSWGFQRLSGVTQVVTPTSLTFAHSRLTHSLKVAQVARRISAQLRESGDCDFAADNAYGLDDFVCEAAALAHDIGHPPFGHAGETVLDEIARDELHLRDGFEGNAQTFRIATQLEFRSTKYRGMNLTAATRGAILKYPWRRADRHVRHDEEIKGNASYRKKWCKFNVYDCDYHEFEEVCADLGCREDQQTLECSIMDMSDDIAYALHDLEEFYFARMFPRNRVLAELEEYRRDTTVDNVFRKLSSRLKALDPNFSQENYERAIKERVHFVIFSLSPDFEGSGREFAEARSLFAGQADHFLRGIKCIEDDGQAKLGIDPIQWYTLQILKELTREHVISRPDLALIQLGQRRMLTDIVDQLLTWSEKDFRRLPIVLRKDLWPEEKSEHAEARAIIDYVSGLTDAQAVLVHRGLTGGLSGVSESGFF